MARVLGAAVAALSALSLAPVVTPGPVASADGCPDVEVVFARGIGEAPGPGWIGQQFVDALRWRMGWRPFDVYPVNYPAVPDFATTVDGVIDAGNHIRGTAEVCPDTRIVLGGFSRGAAVAGYVTGTAGPVDSASELGMAGPPPPAMPAPLPPETAGHIAAVVLLGMPSNTLLSSRGQPQIFPDPAYAARTVNLCAAGDPVCSAGGDDAAHGSYAANGMVAQAADFAAERLPPPQ